MAAANKKERITENIIAEIDWYVIERVRELRKSNFSQSALSREIGFSDSFIGRIENPSKSAVYNLRHLNLIANALKVNIIDLLPKEPIKNDLIRLTIKWKQPTKIKKGEVNYEIIETTPLTYKEIVEYNNKVLSRPSKSGTAVKPQKRKPGKNKKK